MFLLTLMTCMCNLVYGQCREWKWPEDKHAAEEKVAILQDAVRGKKWHQGVGPLNWILTNAPQLNYSIYVHGVTIYEALASSEKIEDRKKKYVDSLFLLYDMRTKQCGEAKNVMWRKTSAAFKLLINTSMYGKILPLMDSLFHLYPETVPDGLLLSYMQTAVVTRQKSAAPDDEGILERFQTINELINVRMKEHSGDQKKQAQLTNVREQVEEWLFKIIKSDCDFVKVQLAPRFKSNPSDLAIAKRIFTFMLSGKCSDDPLWLEAAVVIFKKEKDFGLGKNIALRYLGENNFLTAEAYLDSTLALAPSAADSSEVYYYRGLTAAQSGNKPEARALYLKSLALDKNRTDAAERIGDLYFESFKDCAKLKVQAEDRGNYLAAYSWYARAGNEKKMNMARAAFPSREEIFLVNKKKGDKMLVNCWINEEVVIQTRD